MKQGRKRVPMQTNDLLNQIVDSVLTSLGMFVTFLADFVRQLLAAFLF